MTRISFYVLKSVEPEQRQAFACRLAEKIYHQGQQVYIHTENATESAALDQALWAIRADSFVPHEQVKPDAENNSPVLIGLGFAIGFDSFVDPVHQLRTI